MTPLNKPQYNQDYQAGAGYHEKSRGAVFGLLFLGIAIVFLGVWQVAARVKKPFNPKFTDNVAVSGLVNEPVDTDMDSLSDYDEMYVYGTSPYLEDSDSDNISDAEEVNRGSDPNCPEGGNCLSTIDFEAQSSANENVDPVGTIADNVDAGSGLGDINVSETTSEEDLRRALSGEIDATSLRALLIESGADAEMLSQISDEDLVASYQEVLNNQAE